MKVLGYLLAVGCAALLALLEVALVPLRAGSMLVPVSMVVAIAGNAVLPPLARRMTGVASAAAVPLVVWLIVVVAPVLLPGNSGDFVLPAKSGEQYVFYGVLLAGIVAGAVSSMSFVGRRPARPVSR